MSVSLWGKATGVVSDVVKDTSAAVKTAAADAAALKIGDVFDIDKAVLNKNTGTVAPPDPELSKTRVPAEDEAPDSDKFPVWAIPAAVAVVVVLFVVTLFSKGKKGGK